MKELPQVGVPHRPSFQIYVEMAGLRLRSIASSFVGLRLRACKRFKSRSDLIGKILALAVRCGV